MATIRGLLALILVAILVLLSVSPDASGLMWAVLVPLLVCAALVAIRVFRAFESRALPFGRSLAPASPRSPPQK